ncbi:MAG TPA: hypothetical protein VE713_19125, partial [Pyrinomonadaceae bacterium]|nr:hypothetical protein [Pyrinomonadaceae bacterium]
MFETLHTTKTTRRNRQSVLRALLLLLLCHAALAAVRAQQRPRIVGRPSADASSGEAAQEPGEVVRVNTRVVFLDALVRAKR